jgi:hypothetical protein
MNPEPAIDRDLLERLDACRPRDYAALPPELAGLDEQLARDPRLADVAARLARWDEQVTEAMHDVQAPAGLEQRLIEALDRAAADQVGLAAPTVRHGVSRRRWLAATAAVAAGLCAVAATIWALRPAPWSLDQLVDAAAAWDQELSGDWRAIEDAPVAFPVPAMVLARPRRWQPAPAGLSAAGAVYDLASPLGQRAVLLVARTATTNLPTRPPASPQSTTGGQAIGAWQTAGLVYVLVVQGDSRAYRSCLDLPSATPVAARSLPTLRPAA